MSHLWLMTGRASSSRLVVNKRLEGLSGQMEATFIRSHLGRWLLIEGLTVTCHFGLMSFVQMSLRTNVTKLQKSYSLQQALIYYGCKKFYNFALGDNLIKIVFFISVEDAE
jgi:hypothetical protein